jgi:hypothetical protein
MRALLIVFVFGLAACGTVSGVEGPSGYSGRLTIAQIDELRSREALLPIAPDSVIERYRRYPPAEFNREFAPRIAEVAEFIDSLNQGLSPELRIDTLAIDHTFEDIGAAGRLGGKLYLSSSFFFLYDGSLVLRSVVTHEFGHIHYDMLTQEERQDLEEIWSELQHAALFYVFADGEYSANARFGGHPQDTPEELFASAFNLFRNNEPELQARLAYVDPEHYAAIRRLKSLVLRQLFHRPS